MKNLYTLLKAHLLKYLNVGNNYKNKSTFNNLTMEEKEELNNLKQKYIKTFEEFNKDGKAHWMTPEQLSGVTGTSITQVNNVVHRFSDFVKNDEGYILTRKQYEELTPLLKKLYDQLINKIK